MSTKWVECICGLLFSWPRSIKSTKGIVDPNILSLLTHPQVVPNMMNLRTEK